MVSASPTTVPANGSTATTVDVTVVDQNGGPISGKTISLGASGGSSTVKGPNGATNAKGVTTFTVTGINPEAVTYSATDVTAGFVVVHQATVTFTGPPSPSTSTIAATPPWVPDNNLATSTVVVTLRDQNTNPVAGKIVRLRTAGGQSSITPVAPGSDRTDQIERPRCLGPRIRTAGEIHSSMTRAGGVTVQHTPYRRRRDGRHNRPSSARLPAAQLNATRHPLVAEADRAGSSHLHSQPSGSTV